MGAIGFFAVCIAIIAIGWAICERVWIHFDGNDALQQTTPLERLTAAAVAGAMVWLGVNWLLALTHTLTRASLLIAAVACMIAALILIRRNVVRNRGWLYFIIVCICLAISASYELLEWRVSVATGAKGDAFLGTQGDVWDTQEDMATALVAAMIAPLTLGWLHDRQIDRADRENRS